MKNALRNMLLLVFLSVGLLLGGCFASTARESYMPSQANVTATQQGQVQFGNYIWVKKSFKIWPSGNIVENCPPNTMVIGGGVNTLDPSGGGRGVAVSAPNATYNGWNVKVSTPVQGASIIVYAVCVPK